MHHCGTVADCPPQLVAGLNFNQLYARAPELMVERITMRLLDDDLRFHSRQIRQLLDEAFVVTSQNAGESGLHCACRAGSHQSAVAFWQFEHLRYALSRRDLQCRHAYEMPRCLRHLSLDLGM